jgi:hypothetical protein
MLIENGVGKRPRPLMAKRAPYWHVTPTNLNALLVGTPELVEKRAV